MEKDISYYIDKLSGHDVEGQYALLEMPEEYFSNKLILNMSLSYFSRFIINNRERIVQKVMPHISKNKEMIKVAIERSQGLPGIIMKYIEPELQDDDEIVELICVQQPSAFVHSSERLKNDKDFVKKIVEQNWEVLKYVKDEFLFDDELLNIAFLKNKNILSDLGIG